MQEDESESEPETAETVPPPKNMAIFQEPDTQPPETETACGLDGLDGLDGKILCSYDSGGNYDSFAAYTLNYGEDTSELIDTIKNFTFYIGWTEPFNVYKSFSLYAEWTVYTGTAQDGDGGMPLSPESLDSTVPGTYQVKGTLILPKGCQWKDGFIPPVPVIPISILENGEKKLLTRLNDADFSYYLQPALYEVNSSYYSYDLESLPEYALTFTEDYSSAVMLDTHWDYSAVDISRPGTYTAHVQLTLPETYQQEYSLDPSLETCSKTIYVRASGTLCLYVQYIDNRFAGDWLEPLEEASIIPYYLTSEKELTDTELENSHFIPCTDSSLFAFFLLGAALIAVGVFLSSLTDNQGLAAGLGIAVILLNYYSVSLSEYVSSTPVGALAALLVLILAAGAVVRYLTRNSNLAYGVCLVLLAAVAALYFVDSTAFEGLLPTVMSALSLFERFYTFVNGVFDLTAVFYYLTVAALFLFLSVQSLEKRRYN